MRLFLNAGLSDCCACAYAYGNMLLECAGFIAFQISMLYSVSSPRILISSCHPLTSLSSVSHPSPNSTFILLFLPQLLYRPLRPIHLTPDPSAALLFDVSLIPPPSFNLGSFLHLSQLPSLSLFLSFSRLISLTFRALLFFPLCLSGCFSVTAYPHQHLSPFSSPATSLFRICNFSHFLASSISH